MVYGSGEHMSATGRSNSKCQPSLWSAHSSLVPVTLCFLVFLLHLCFPSTSLWYHEMLGVFIQLII